MADKENPLKILDEILQGIESKKYTPKPDVLMEIIQIIKDLFDLTRRIITIYKELEAEKNEQ